jgi:tetratricopeptide (TPR) repeat protein
MAEISLRAYVKEIDNLIERDQLDEAISHCRHILESYPKHLETYRLLGKAYLEAKRFGDAADIFQRVLSSIPDDFVSHIGMAIVREDEGNLESAIWHMERAYETNPSNPAIRQELSRLIGRRDGLEPHKIRLTRGALARQYTQGELYPQAIAELRSALQEEPDRPDLHVMLASMYWLSGEYELAQDSCKRILEKLPFCFEANRIMAAILQEDDKITEATEYHRRLAALDPYASFVESAAIDPKTVDANSVRIDRLDWRPGQPLPSTEPGQPEWVASLGVDLSEESEETEVSSDSPPWLRGVESTPSIGVRATPALVGAAAVKDMTDNSNAEDNQIPEWMREAGWQDSSGEAEDGPVSFSDDELEALESGAVPPSGSDDELAPADIPSWLQDIAPSDEEVAAAAPPPARTPAEPAAKRGEVPDWLSDITSDAGDVPPDPTEPGLSEPAHETPGFRRKTAGEPLGDFDFDAIPGGGSSEVPTWIEDEAPGATSTIITWLGDMTSAEGEDTLPGQTPDWLGDTTPFADEPASEDLASRMELASEDEPEREAPKAPAARGAPSWLAGVAAAASHSEPVADDEPEPAGEEAGTPPGKSGFTFPPQRASSEETPAWLSGISASDLESSAESPDWLDELRPSEDEPGYEIEPGEAPSWTREAAADELGMGEDEEPAAVPADVPDWLKGIGEEPEGERPPAERDVPEWLSGIAEPEPDLSFSQEDADWLGSIEEPAAQETPQGGRESGMDFDVQALRAAVVAESGMDFGDEEPESQATAEVGFSDELDDEEVFDWLEKLARDQEEEAPSGVTRREEAHVPAAPPPSPEAMISAQAPPDEPEASMDWLEELASQRGVEAEVEFTPSVEVPAEEPEFAMPPIPEAEPELEPEGSSQAPDWLREMASTPVEEPEIPSAPQVPAAPAFAEEQPRMEEPEVPDWLKEPVEAPAASAPTRPAPPPPAIEEAQSQPSVPASKSSALEPEREPAGSSPFAPPSSAVPPAMEEIAREKPIAIEPEREVITPVAAEASPRVSEPSREAPAAAPAPRKHKKEPPVDSGQLLQDARHALAAGDAGHALSNYRKLIDKKKEIDTVISDLERASQRYPNLPTMWQTLGDAYMKVDRLSEAIKAYQRGMEVA